MPSSPKSFYPSRQSWLAYNRRTSISICFLLIGIFGFIFGLVSILRPVSSYNNKCRTTSEPLSVSVVWEKSSGNSGSDLNIGDSHEDHKRHKVMGFVGIQTGFGSVGRRKSLRKTWMPSDRQGLQRLEEATGLAFRFVIGRTSGKSKMLELKKEIEEYDDFILLDIEEEYSKLPYKTLAFFKAAYGLFESDFYVKADDDIYLRPDRLSLLLAKERSDPRTYLGCMKKGPVFTDPKLKWYEPLGFMLGKEYFLHAYGPLYALSSEVVSSLVALRNDSFRMFSNEDVTIGAWMLAMNVNHEDNRALCESECTPSFVAVWDIPACSGLCDPEKKLLKLHEKESCVNTPTLESDDE